MSKKEINPQQIGQAAAEETKRFREALDAFAQRTIEIDNPTALIQRDTIDYQQQLFAIKRVTQLIG